MKEFGLYGMLLQYFVHKHGLHMHKKPHETHLLVMVFCVYVWVSYYLFPEHNYIFFLVQLALLSILYWLEFLARLPPFNAELLMVFLFRGQKFLHS